MILKIQPHNLVINLPLIIQLVNITPPIHRRRKSQHPFRPKLPNGRLWLKKRHHPDTDSTIVIRPLIHRLFKAHVVLDLLPRILD